MKNLFSFILVISLYSCGSGSYDDINYENTDYESSALETVIDASTETSTVQSFVSALGNSDYQSAYDLTKVKAWGSFEKFSSTKAFGGITSTRIDKIEQLPNEDGKSVVYVEAFYADQVNGNANFKQKFYLQQFGADWKIVKMKLLSKEGADAANTDYSGSYGFTLRDDCCTQSNGLTLTKIQNNIYEFSIGVYVGSDDEQMANGCACEFMGEDGGQIKVENGKAEYSYSNGEDSYTYFFIFEKNKIKIKSSGFNGWHYSPDGIYKKK